MTASRRLAPLPLLLIALLGLVLGGVLLWSKPAEAQTVHNLVLNTNQGSGDTVSTDGDDLAQLFSTGGGDTYTLTQVIVLSTDLEGDDFDIEICGADTTDDEFPTADCTALTAPASFAAGELLFTHEGIALSADTNYVVVFKQSGTGSVRLGTTTSGGEDSGVSRGGASKTSTTRTTAPTGRSRAGPTRRSAYTSVALERRTRTPPAGWSSTRPRKAPASCLPTRLALPTRTGSSFTAIKIRSTSHATTGPTSGSGSTA